MDCISRGSSFHEILQARILEWIAIPFSRESSWPKEPGSPALPADSVPSEPPDETVFNYYSAFFSDLEALDKLYGYRWSL